MFGMCLPYIDALSDSITIIGSSAPTASPTATQISVTSTSSMSPKLGRTMYLPMPSTEMASLLLESSPELAAVDTAQRGWTEMTLTPEAMTSQWRFVSDVALPTYTTTTGPLMQCRAGARKLS